MQKGEKVKQKMTVLTTKSAYTGARMMSQSCQVQT